MEKIGQEVLLLGGEGFVGKNIQNGLKGRFSCVSVALEESPFGKIPGTVFLQLDPYKESLPESALSIIHLIDNSFVPFEEYLKAEEQLAKNVHLEKSKYIILFSSAVIYANPDSEYGKRKQSLEKFYTEYCENQGIKLLIVRLFNTFGPYQLPYRQGSLVANIICNHLTEKETKIQWIEAKRDFIFSEDIALFVEFFLKNEVTGTVDLGSGVLTSLREVIEKINSKVGGTLQIQHQNEEETLKIVTAKNSYLNQVPTQSLDEALEKTIEFYRQNLEYIRSL